MSEVAKCLVLGANGFIGSHLVDDLASAGHKVLALDRFFSKPRFQQSDLVTPITDDLSSLEGLNEYLQDVDYVFHSISATTPFSSDKDPYTDIDLNLKRTVHIFEMCANAGVKKVIFISSGGAIYGHIAEEKYVTEDDVATPVSPYGICKLAAEHYLAYFQRTAGLEYVALRLTNPYGPRQFSRNNQGVIAAFIQKIKDGEDLEVFGDGSSTRDYIYIKDVTRMIAQTFTGAMEHHTYNIGSGKQTSVQEIIEILKGLATSDINVEYQDGFKTFLKSAKVSTERFTNEFGIKPEYELEQGLRQTLEADKN